MKLRLSQAQVRERREEKKRERRERGKETIQLETERQGLRQ